MDINKQELEQVWLTSIDLAEKADKRLGLNESKLGCMLHAYTAFVRAVANSTIQLLEEQKLITVSGNHEEVVIQLATSPMFFAGTTSMIAEISKTWRE